MPTSPSAPLVPSPSRTACPASSCSTTASAPLTEDRSGTIAVAVAPGFVEAGLDDVAIAYSREVQQVEVTDAELTAHIERLTTAAERQIELARSSNTDDEGLEADVRNLAN